ncbi:MAG: hypothetical protein VX922_05265 [Candidatus Neomarinimicrobiota bacterium]|nr:hypothetical protein [Candidatus Neomarinimicrobiota bacterium]
MLKFLTYLIYGWIILIVAIPVNFIAKEIGLITWYGFLVFKDSIGFLDVVFMFILYPLILGSAIGIGKRFVLSNKVEEK